jgi:S-formylglutathione hydrolase
MMNLRALAILSILSIGPARAASEIVTGEMETNLLPHPLHYTVLLPDGYQATGQPLPVVFALHGGNGDHGFLGNIKDVFDAEWAAGTIPKLIAVTPDAERSFYMDYKDGSRKWDTLISGPFLEYLRKKYNIGRDRKSVYVFGISMGGMGALRLGLKHPDVFAGLGALEPGIDPALHWKDVLPRHRFWRSQELMESIYGKPIDAAYWEANNPASIADSNPDKIRSFGIGIYLDVGDQDSYGLNEATEFMHRILMKNHIEHEYHLIHGADHVGRTIHPRMQETLRFLGRVMNPPPPDPVAAALKKQLAPLREKAQ